MTQVLTKCTGCAGTGKVWRKKNKSSYIKLECFHCGGTGKMVDKEASSTP